MLAPAQSSKMNREFVLSGDSAWDEWVIAPKFETVKPSTASPDLFARSKYRANIDNVVPLFSA